ncbi:MAG TPA: lamin tail domain-containing protein [Patescibacteria group bacterium]|nr:lamin tail domain-containing protein [Patescibacteria group bacterium]
MKQLVCLSFFLFSFFFLSPIDVFAKLWINEFSSYESSNDWMEIYNDGDTTVDLSSYKFRDESASNKVILSGSIQPGEFLEVNLKNYLNKDGDTIKLVDITDESNILDEVHYGNSGNDSLAPESGQSAGRNPDGGTQWVVFANSSPGTTNGGSLIVPTATLIPTNTPTPTRTPTPTKVPTPTYSASRRSSEEGSGQAKILTPTKLPTSIPTKSVVLAAKVKPMNIGSSQKPASNSSYPTPVLKASQSATPYHDEKKDVLVKNASVNYGLVGLLIVGGLFFVACAILVLIRNRKQNDYE